MDVYAAAAINIATPQELYNRNFSVFEIIAAGISTTFADPAVVSKRNLSLDECLQIARDATPMQVQSMSDMVRTILAMESSEIVKLHIKLVDDILKRIPNAKDTLIVGVGSSADKLTMILEYMGYACLNVPFSRDFWYDRGDPSDNIIRKIVKDFSKIVSQNIISNMKSMNKRHIAILDMIDTGNTFLSVLKLLEKTLPSEMYRKVFPVILSPPSTQPQPAVYLSKLW